MAESHEQGRLGELMERRLRKLAALASTTTRLGSRATAAESRRHSSALLEESLLQSLGKRRSIHDRKVVGDLVRPTRRNREIAQELKPESLQAGTGTTVASVKSSKDGFHVRSGETARAERSADSTKIQMRKSSAVRHLSATNQFERQVKAVRIVTGGIARRIEAGKQEKTAATLLNERSKPRRLNSQSSNRFKIDGRQRASMLTASKGDASIGGADGIASEYKARDGLGQRLRLRETEAPRLMTATKSRSDSDAAKGRMKTMRRGVESERDEANHRSTGVKNSPLVKESLRSGLRATRMSDRYRAALTVNFNPSVLLQAEPDVAAKKNIVEALSRHSYELVQLIEQEMAKQRRVQFSN